MAAMTSDLDRLKRLRRMVRGGPEAPARWSAEALAAFPRLYRQACSFVARLESGDRESPSTAEARRVVGQAQAILHARRSGGSLLATVGRVLLVACPRAIRLEWRLLLGTGLVLYGLAGLAWFAVSRDLDIAPSLLDPAVVEGEIQELRALEPGERFVGNFEFGIGESPQTAGLIMMNNMRVGVLFFASALLPPVYLYVLASNSLMLGTYTAVAGHWGQAGSISSILWCHGVLEIQAILLAGAAGLCLVRAWIRPGARTRRHALVVESKRALLLLLPTFPILFAAGTIEGYVSPHAPLGVRLSVAAGSGLALFAYVLAGGRRTSTTSPDDS